MSNARTARALQILGAASIRDPEHPHAAQHAAQRHKTLTAIQKWMTPAELQFVAKAVAAVPEAKQSAEEKAFVAKYPEKK